MSDVFDKKERSRIMTQVKGSGNKSTEGKLIAYFKSKGITGWRRNYTSIGKPDFVFLKNKVAIFTDGCFWHGHDCRGLTPKQNSSYWQNKISKNKSRDKEVTKRFQVRGWRVIRLWECEIKKDYLDKYFPLTK